MVDKSVSGETTDQHLVAGFLAGNTDCFGVLVERYWSMAVALAFSIVRDAAQAEDVAQESFLRAYSHLRELRDPSRLAGWLARIVTQRSADCIRRRAREAVTPMLEPSDLAAPAATPGNPGLTDKQRRLVRSAVERLPEKSRHVVIMRFIGELSTEQIAHQLGRRTGTVRVCLHRAYKKLRKALAPLAEEV
jgi:RNA polymerase sigma-70 factor (ECF subfamily)